MQHKQNVSSLMMNNKVTNGNGLIDNREQEQHHIRQSPVLLSSNTSSHVMRSRLNQYKINNVVVNFDESGTETAVVRTTSKSRKKKSSADI